MKRIGLTGDGGPFLLPILPASETQGVRGLL
nr:MAG TPA: hypothetical protein [Caudoviricetes sp.]